MYDLSGIGVHIEISANCNSRCLDCGRYVKGTDLVNPYLEIGSKGLMSLATVNNVFDEEISKNLRYVNFTGTYGEATTHPNFFDILNLIADNVDRQKEHRLSHGSTDKVKLMIETNGGMHTPEYWREFSNIVKNRFARDSVIIFGIDGTDDDTHQMYRRGVNFDKVLANAAAVIDNKVNAVWSMISFNHNEHQLDNAKTMSKSLGFKAFKIRRSRLRSVATQTVTVLSNEYQKKKNISAEELSYSSEHSKFFTVTNAKSDRFYFENKIDSYFDETSVECEWKITNKVNVDYTSRVWQCCYFSTFYHAPVEYHNLDKVKDLNFVDRIKDYEKLSHYENQYEPGWNFASLHKLSDILNHSFFTKDLVNSFNNSTSDVKYPRIYRCAKHCGERARNLDTELRKINEKIEQK